MTQTPKGFTPEDARIIAAAANDRRISPDYIDVWCNAMRADAEGTRRALASLPRGWTAAADDLERAQNGVAASLKRMGLNAPRNVAAADLSSHAAPAGPNPPSALELGRRNAFGIDGTEPVVIEKGVRPEDYTREQRYQAFVHMLGGKFTQGVPKPPAGDVIYQPSPNDNHYWDAEAGEFKQKPNNRAMPI